MTEVPSSAGVLQRGHHLGVKNDLICHLIQERNVSSICSDTLLQVCALTGGLSPSVITVVLNILPYTNHIWPSTIVYLFSIYSYLNSSDSVFLLTESFFTHYPQIILGMLNTQLGGKIYIGLNQFGVVEGVKMTRDQQDCFLLGNNLW